MSLGYAAPVSGIVTFLLLKLVVVGIGAFIWGAYCGRTGRDLSGRLLHDRDSDQR